METESEVVLLLQVEEENLCWKFENPDSAQCLNHSRTSHFSYQNPVTGGLVTRVWTAERNYFLNENNGYYS
jgi:hypothetical protein